MNRKKLLLPGAALVTGVLIVVVLVQLREPPRQSASGASPPNVRVMEASPIKGRVIATGYGSATSSPRASNC